jgi:hypothetical protein
MYKGRTLKVTGAVESINKNAFGEIYVVLADGNEFSGVQAKLQGSEVAQAGRLSRGEEVTVVCKGATMIIGTPMLEDCTFSQAEPPQRVAPTPSSASDEQPTTQQPAPVQTVPAIATTPATAAQETDPCDKPVDPPNPVAGINACGDSLAKFAKDHPEPQ